VGICVIVCIQKPSHHFLQTFRPLSMFKIVLRDCSLYPKQSRAYARGLGLTPLELDILQKRYYPRKGDWLIVFAYFLLVNLSTYCKYHGMNLHANFKEYCKRAKMSPFSGVPAVAIDCIVLNYWGKHKRNMAIRGIN